MRAATADLATQDEADDFAERSVIGSLMSDGSALMRIPFLKAPHFQVRSYQLAYRSVCALAERGSATDMMAVAEHLQSVGALDAVGGLPALNEFAESAPSTDNIGAHARHVHQKAVGRTLAASLADPRGRTIAQILETAQRELDESAPSTGTQWAATLSNWTPPADILSRHTAAQWAVQGLIQRAKVGALVAAGGTGKTTLLLTMGICIALGIPFFGMPTTAGTFVLVSGDDSQEDLDGALSRVALAMELSKEEAATVGAKFRVVSLQGGSGATFTYTDRGETKPTDLADVILKAVSGINDLVGIAFDTLRQFSGGSSNDEQVIKHTISACTRVANATGAFVVLPHHTGKQNYRDGVQDMYAGSGSAAIADNCRFVLLLQSAAWADIEQKVGRTGQEVGDPLVLLSTRGSLLVKPPEAIFLCRRDYLVKRIAGRSLTRDQQFDLRDRKILAAVRLGAQTKNTILGAVHGKRQAVFAAVDDLLRRGLLIYDEAAGSRGGSPKLMVSAEGGRHLDAQPE